jgi:hypothetical protein
MPAARLAMLENARQVDIITRYTAGLAVMHLPSAMINWGFCVQPSSNGQPSGDAAYSPPCVFYRQCHISIPHIANWTRGAAARLGVFSNWRDIEYRHCVFSSM